MKILILGNGVMANIVKDNIGNTDEFIAMLDTKYELKCDEEFDVIIDFSHHSATKKIIDFAVEKNKPILIATTGQTNDELEYIEKAKEKINLSKISNTSLGVYAVNELVKKAAEILKDFDISIIEKHHTRKIDAPSGTAITIADSIKEVNKDAKIEMHSIRAGNISGEHTILFAGIDEIVEIKHTATSRKIFALGAIKYARELL
ncbi:4-hydroxy-tetrahydrodipicolinate reductase [Oceanivirga salmonicida]|uniref:4-hydroxy-tetrahydrodipicolinate reductase n=1 Tax=Oceanivirga salmonicida TaxID=1769291 RepID=UPI00083336BE|nr:dihydrodipicolinate reductase C-terminal domain-containing protein [Oceanivirga salmonicida]